MEPVDINDVKRIKKKVMQNPSAGKQWLDAAISSSRFEEDPIYRLNIQSILSIYYTIVGNYSQAILQVQEILEKGIALSLWELTADNYNALAVVYTMLHMADKAFETYQHLIRFDLKYELKNKLPFAYNNLGILYRNLGDHEKAMENFELAVEGLKNIEEAERSTVFLNFAPNLVIEYSKEGYFEKAEEIIAYFDILSHQDIDLRTQCQVLEAKMHYFIYKKEFEQAENSLAQLIAAYLELQSVFNYLENIAVYAELCQELGAPEERFMPYVLAAKSHFSDDHSGLIIRLYRLILKACQNKNDHESVAQYYPEYTYYMEIYSKVIKTQQRNAINTLYEIEEARAENRLINEKNEQLRQMTEEALARKQELSQANAMLQIISRIGQKVTSARDIPAIAEFVYSCLCEQMPVSVFFLMVINETQTHLESVFVVDEGVRQPDHMIDIYSSKSIVAKCYRENRMIISNHVQEDPSLCDILSPEIINEKAVSAVYFPLTYEEQTVGVCSIQNAMKDSYNEEHVVFLEYLKPYLAISLSNAIRAKWLQKEIEAHCETQGKLQEVNAYLERISSIDGLTGVNNRRYFETCYTQLVKEAEAQQEMIGILMIDIDFFKNYNDHYGHPQGDAALIQVANGLKAIFDAQDILFARFGGEEFIGAIKGSLTLEKLEKLCHELLLAIEKLKIRHFKTESGFLSISIGASLCKEAFPMMKTRCIEQADEYLYQAKNSGRNRYVVGECKTIDLKMETDRSRV